MQRLPDAEFDVMKAVWSLNPPFTASQALSALDGEREWRVQTVITLLGRLVERGFLRTEKHGKDRIYVPSVSKEVYLAFETGNFIRQYHSNSFTSLVSALHSGSAISDEDASVLLRWLQERDG